MAKSQEVTPYPDFTRYFDVGITDEFDNDPNTYLAELAKKAPVVAGRNGVFEGIAIPNNFLLPDKDQDLFLALSFDAVRQVATDVETFSSKEGFKPTYGATLGKILIQMDGAEHKKYRRLVLPSFAHSMVNEEVATVVRPIVNQCLDTFVDQGEAELQSAFSHRFPYLVIAALFGVPEALQGPLAEATGDAFSIGLDPEKALAAQQKLETYYQEIINDHRQTEPDDLTTMLLKSEIDGERLTDAEAGALIREIMGGGLDSTTRQFGNMIMLLLENPDQLEKLRQQPELLDNTITEALRHSGTGGFFPRIAVKDTEVCGVPIPAGSGVYGMIRAANYDEKYWSDPFRFDITRKTKPIMSFNMGAHACLGQSLARAELKIALEAVLERLPNLRKDEDRWESAKMRGFQFRAPTQLPVKWG